MSRFTYRTLGLLAALGAFVLAGCASTGLVNVWAMQDFTTPMRSMLVVVMKRNEGNRRIMEDAFVRELDKYGVKATAAYKVFPAVPDTAEVRQYVLDNHLNGVLVAARLPTRHETQEVPGYTTSEARTRYNSWTGRYQTYYTQVEVQPTTETVRVVPHRVDVWYSDHKGGELVWTAEGRSIDPSSANQVSQEISSDIVPALAKAGMIPQKIDDRN